MEHLQEWNIFKKKKIKDDRELDGIKIGDYVLAEPYAFDIPEVVDFIKNNIGKVVDFWEERVDGAYFIVEYENAPKEYKSEFSYIRNKWSKFREKVWAFSRGEIKYFGTKKDVEEKKEMLLQTKKYNL